MAAGEKLVGAVSFLPVGYSLQGPNNSIIHPYMVSINYICISHFASSKQIFMLPKLGSNLA